MDWLLFLILNVPNGDGHVVASGRYSFPTEAACLAEVAEIENRYPSSEGYGVLTDCIDIRAIVEGRT